MSGNSEPMTVPPMTVPAMTVPSVTNLGEPTAGDDARRPTLSVEGLRVAYGDTVAVEAFDLSVRRGEVVVLLGPSGCGKSSVLRAVAGLETAARGRVRLDDVDVTATAAHRRGVGLMFQDYALFPHRDVAGNVGFGLRMRGNRPGAIARRVGEVLALVGLDGYERRAVHELSGGEQQRVALARAVAPAPKVLLLDEPIGALDRALRDRLLGELRALFDVLGITVVYVTHDQTEAFTLADRVVVMRDGRVVQEGRPVDVWRRPGDVFVARFLGFTNLVPTTVRDGVASSPWGAVELIEPGGAGGAEGSFEGAATLVVRPDGLRLGAGPVTGTVVRTTFAGDHFVVVVATDAGPELSAAAAAGNVPTVGDAVRLSIEPEGVTVVAGRDRRPDRHPDP